ncbi:probable 2-oxoglutarate-dependent dioxygenase At3g111800 isoform X2 [Phoenix dactylifera]|uniref:Probable 2-oxoglutarate-dependent dioxygenase At3g111800 isoform X2 n=1 Tax=Phoenix dactylifera TaxID=42345 RepID=A0A8B9A2Q8_PHODC|nr:probable 2-oxoglutarate-dependent dioxygenase At3g111800 isoform X2 [Phoenix dactylifera]
MDCLQKWPEPVVPVQALSESGAAVIPERYVKPASERPSLNSTADKIIVGIPTIDLGGLAEGTAECRATMRAISDACRDWGFFQVVNHGVSHELMERIQEVWRGFFYLPMEAKTAYANTPLTYEGYGSRVGVEKGAILDWGDYYFLQYLPQSAKNYDKWPSMPISIRDTTEEYGREMVKLCGILMKVMSLSLGLDAEFLHKAFGGDDVGACLRANYYPKCPQPDLTLGLSPHSDPGVMTVLLADDQVKGLQVRKGGEWITVQPLPHAFIVNVGDQIQLCRSYLFSMYILLIWKSSMVHRTSQKQRIGMGQSSPNSNLALFVSLPSFHKSEYTINKKKKEQKKG